MFTIYVHALIYIGGALWWTIYMTLIGYAIYNGLGVLISACLILLLQQ